MSGRTIHPPGPSGPITYACAQAGCRDCLERLLREHEPLIHLMVRRQCRWGIDYVDLVQRRIAVASDLPLRPAARLCLLDLRRRGD
jgi:hypothetical protein